MAKYHHLPGCNDDAAVERSPCSEGEIFRCTSCGGQTLISEVKEEEEADDLEASVDHFFMKRSF
jgi:hypothetical protein